MWGFGQTKDQIFYPSGTYFVQNEVKSPTLPHQLPRGEGGIVGHTIDRRGRYNALFTYITADISGRAVGPFHPPPSPSHFLANILKQMVEILYRTVTTLI